MDLKLIRGLKNYLKHKSGPLSGKVAVNKLKIQLK
jgi:hypothetical protein